MDDIYFKWIERSSKGLEEFDAPSSSPCNLLSRVVIPISVQCERKCFCVCEDLGGLADGRNTNEVQQTNVMTVIQIHVPCVHVNSGIKNIPTAEY